MRHRLRELGLTGKVLMGLLLIVLSCCHDADRREPATERARLERSGWEGNAIAHSTTAADVVGF